MHRINSMTSSLVADNSKMSHRLETALNASFFFGITFAAKINRLVVSNLGGKSLGNWLLP